MKPKSNHNPLTGVSRQAEWRRRAIADANNWRQNEALERIIAAAYARETRARRIA